jgi:hypothetical protein
VDWIRLAQDRAQWQDCMKTVMEIQIPLKVDNFMTSLAVASFSESILLHDVRYDTLDCGSDVPWSTSLINRDRLHNQSKIWIRDLCIDGQPVK